MGTDFQELADDAFGLDSGVLEVDGLNPRRWMPSKGICAHQ